MIILLQRLADIWTDTAELARLRDLTVRYAAQVNEVAHCSNAWQARAGELALELAQAARRLGEQQSLNIRQARQLELQELLYARCCRAGNRWRDIAQQRERELARLKGEGP